MRASSYPEITKPLDIPFSRWYPAIEKRRSRRQFDAGRPIEPGKLSELETMCNHFMPHSSARSCLVTEPAKDVFKGVIGRYGKIKDAPAFIAFIGNMDNACVQEAVGYTGEGVILEATALGLDTCWVGGFFKRDGVASQMDIKSNEKILAITPVGYARRFESLEEKLMTGFGRTHRRVSISKLSSGMTLDSAPDWIKISIQAARLAPSAINRQPWGFHVEDDGITVYVRTSGPEFSVSKRLDCGIAMMHIELGALSCGIRGKWEIPKAPGVSKFSVLT